MPTVAFGPVPWLSVRAVNTLGQTLARMGLVQVTDKKNGIYRYKPDSIPSAAIIAANVTLEDMLKNAGYWNEDPLGDPRGAYGRRRGAAVDRVSAGRKRHDAD